MKLRAKFLSVLMSVALAAGLSPAAAWADENNSAIDLSEESATFDGVIDDGSSAADAAALDGAVDQLSEDGSNASEDKDDSKGNAANPEDLLTNDAAREYDASAPYVDGEVLVVYQQSGEAAVEEGVTDSQMLEEARVDLDENGIIDASETTAALELVDLQVEEQVSESFAGEGAAVIAQIEDGKTVEQAVQEAATVPGVAFVQPNYIYQSLGDQSVANDPQLDQQQSLKAAGFLTSWNAAKTDNQVTVAVLDTGCRLDHEDLQANLLSSLAYDTYNNAGLPDLNLANNGDPSGHGTAVAGIIAAQANNGIGIAGSSFNANIIPVKVFNDDESSPVATTSDVVEGLDYIADLIGSGAAPNLRIVNMSFGFYGSDESDHSLQAAISSLRANGVLCVCAGGNGAGGASVYPADYPETLSVASLSQEGSYSAWSDLSGKNIAAVGEGVLTTTVSSASAYGSQDGSSASAATVSGAAALLIAADPGISVDQVQAALCDGASAVNGQDGPGALNVRASLESIGITVAEEGEASEASEGKDSEKETDDAKAKESEDEAVDEQSVNEDDSQEGEDAKAETEDLPKSFSEASHVKQGPENSWRYIEGVPNPSFNVLSLSATDAKGKGIDVSQWQGDIDWAKVKAAGVKFAIIRCGYGDDYTYQDDYKFARNVSECERLGIPYGVYIYSYAINTTMATSEANHAIRMLKGHKPAYPVYIDIEDKSVRGYDLNAVAETYCKKIASAGYTPGIYASLSWWNDYLSSSALDKYEKWVAQWNVRCDYKKTCNLWQYSSTGSVNGISGYVDMDYEFKSFSSGSSSNSSSSSSATTATTSKPARTVADGVYTLNSRLNTSKVIDVSGGSTSSGANIQLYSKNGTPAQTFRFRYGSDGYYTITNLKSGKALDVSGASKSNGANVQQYNVNGTAAQKWQVRKNADGSYTLINKASGKALDVANGKTSNGTNVQQYSLNGNNAQNFVITSAKRPQTIANGTYTIQSSLSSSMVLDVKGGSNSSGANIQLYKSNNTGAQKFKFSYDAETGFYTITNAKSGRVVDLSGAVLKNRSNIQQYTSNSTLAQRWIVEKSGGYYVLSSSLCPDYVIDVSGANKTNGTNIQLYKWNATKAQKFTLKKV